MSNVNALNAVIVHALFQSQNVLFEYELLLPVCTYALCSLMFIVLCMFILHRGGDK